MKKGVLFDFWGTLVDNKLKPSPMQQAKRMLKVDIPFREWVVRFEEAFMTERFDDLYEAFDSVCDEFDIDADPKLIDKMVGMWNKSYIVAEPYPDTMPMLKQLSQDYKLGLVSNTPPGMRQVMEKFDMEKFFDSIVLSCDVGTLKTDPEMFETVLDELGLEKEEVIMVGDSTHTDMKGAKNAGIKPVLIDRRDSREYEDKITNLQQITRYLEG